MERGRGELGLTLTLAGASLESGGLVQQESGAADLCQKEVGCSASSPSPWWVFSSVLTFNLKIKAQLSVTLRHERDQKTLSWRYSFLGLQAAVSEE